MFLCMLTHLSQTILIKTHRLTLHDISVRAAWAREFSVGDGTISSFQNPFKWHLICPPHHAPLYEPGTVYDTKAL